jgi:hypothetical protein
MPHELWRFENVEKGFESLGALFTRNKRCETGYGTHP